NPLISDDIFEPSNTENYKSGNAENFFNTEFVDPLIFDDMYGSSNTNNYESSNARNFFDTELVDPLMSGSMFGPSNINNFSCEFNFGNPENFFNIVDPNNPEAFFNTFGPGNMEAYFNTFEQSNQNNEAVKCIENSSSLSSNESISLNVTKTHKSQDNEEYLELRYPIELNKSFKNWGDLDEWLNNYAFQAINYKEKGDGDRII
ncbi:7812_t:CDS:2, partial [Gigaspora margarita]